MPNPTFDAGHKPASSCGLLTYGNRRLRGKLHDHTSVKREKLLGIGVTRRAVNEFTPRSRHIHSPSYISQQSDKRFIYIAHNTSRIAFTFHHAGNFISQGDQIIFTNIRNKFTNKIHNLLPPASIANDQHAPPPRDTFGNQRNRIGCTTPGQLAKDSLPQFIFNWITINHGNHCGVLGAHIAPLRGNDINALNYPQTSRSFLSEQYQESRMIDYMQLVKSLTFDGTNY